MNRRIFILVLALFLVTVAPEAFACAQCVTYQDGCPDCFEDNYNGAQSCSLRDITMLGITVCIPQGVCEGPWGNQNCGDPQCGRMRVEMDDDVIKPAEQWQLASVVVMPPVRARGRART